MAASNNMHHHLSYQQLFPDQQLSFGYIVQLTPALFFTNNASDSQQNLRQPSINSPVYHDSNIIYPVYLPVVGMPGNFRLVHMTDASDHNSREVVSMSQGRHDQPPIYPHSYYYPHNQVNLEVEQMERDDSRILEVPLEHVYNEISNPNDESPGVSTRASFTLFGVDISVPVPPMEEEDDVQETDDNVMQVPENNHLSVFVFHYPEEEVAMNMGTIDYMNSLDSVDYDLTFDEEYPELEEQTGQVGSGLSEEKIMGHIQIKYYTPTTTLSPDEERDMCVICQGEFEYGEFIAGLHCRHKYHVQCIKKWLQQMNNCPICKATAVS